VRAQASDASASGGQVDILCALQCVLQVQCVLQLQCARQCEAVSHASASGGLAHIQCVALQVCVAVVVCVALQVCVAVVMCVAVQVCVAVVVCVAVFIWDLTRVRVDIECVSQCEGASHACATHCNTLQHSVRLLHTPARVAGWHTVSVLQCVLQVQCVLQLVAVCVAVRGSLTRERKWRAGHTFSKDTLLQNGADN